jgi:hypothetical protein
VDRTADRPPVAGAIPEGLGRCDATRGHMINPEDFIRLAMAKQ